MLINQDFAIQGGVYYISMMSIILILFLISIRDYLCQFPYVSALNVLLIISDTSIHQEDSQQQSKPKVTLVNIWADINLMLPHYHDCFTLDTSFRYIFTSYIGFL